MLHGTPLAGERGFGGEIPAARRLDLVAQRRDFRGNTLGGLAAILQRLLVARRLLLDFGQLGAHLLAALAVTLLRLRQLELVDLGVVPLLLRLGDDEARMLESLAARYGLDLHAAMDVLRSADLLPQVTAACVERFDPRLSCEQARVGLIRRVKADGVPRELVAIAVDEHRAGRQSSPPRRVGAFFRCIGTGEPVREGA